MSRNTPEELELKIDALEQLIKKVKSELSINKQLLQRAVGEEPTSSIAISELTAITDDEMSDNPQLVFEHATGTKRGYLSQLIEEVISELPEVATQEEVDTGGNDEKSVTPLTLRNTKFINNQIPSATNSDTAGNGFGGFRYTISGSTLNLFTS